jgi:CO/xanthine dehydrogenase FAD-binding subunit
MIPILDAYELVAPRSLSEALEELADCPGSRPLAGGTDLMVALEAGTLPAGRYVSLLDCTELRGIDVTSDRVSLGALTTYTEIRRSPVLQRDYPMLIAAALETGGVATQNRGTVGGNIANASPAADTPPALLAYDASLELMSAAGARVVPYVHFHRGYKKMDLQPGELIARIHLPRRSLSGATRDYYRKVGTRRAQAISKVCFAGTIRLEGDRVQHVRIALGSVAPNAVRATSAEAALQGYALTPAALAAAEEALVSEIAPIDDIRSTALYRTRVACNLLREFLGDRG